MEHINTLHRQNAELLDVHIVTTALYKICITFCSFLKMEARSSYEISVIAMLEGVTFQEGCDLHSHRSQNLKSHTTYKILFLSLPVSSLLSS
jgi:hypothetical protein